MKYVYENKNCYKYFLGVMAQRHKSADVNSTGSGKW